MTLLTTPEEIRRDHPQIWQDLEEQRRKSKAKGAQCPLDEFVFTYEWAHQGRAYRATDFVEKAASGELLQNHKSFDEMSLEERLSKCTAWILARSGRYYITSSCKKIPEPVKDWYSKGLKE